MKETSRLILSLTGICVASGLVLAAVRRVTERPIAEARRAEQLAALNMVLPEHDNDPYAEKYETPDTGLTFHIARKGGAFTGVAFEAQSDKGYGGDIRLILGVTCSNTVMNAVVVEQSESETPGLGAGIVNADFISQFQNGSALETGWYRLRQDAPREGLINAITGATVSSREERSLLNRVCPTTGLPILLGHRGGAGRLQQGASKSLGGTLDNRASFYRTGRPDIPYRLPMEFRSGSCHHKRRRSLCGYRIEIIAIGRYYLDPKSNRAEVAFVVQDK